MSPSLRSVTRPLSSLLFLFLLLVLSVTHRVVKALSTPLATETTTTLTQGPQTQTCHQSSSTPLQTTATTSCCSPSASTTTTTRPIHTLLLCRHGDSIWNGKEPGCLETFTGWCDVPLSQKGICEAKATGEQLGNIYMDGIDVCATSILNRAELTAHYCLWGFGNKPSHLAPQLFLRDYRLNERHYGALQGFVKEEVEQGRYGHDPAQVKAWRRSWHAIPPLLEDDDPRRLAEIKKYQHFCDGPENVPRGESLAMVAKNRIQPFLLDKLTPLLNQAAERNQQQHRQQGRQGGGGGGTALVVAHANSLRALIGVLCRVEENPAALVQLEKMKIPTGVPMMLRYQETHNVPGRFQALPRDSTEEASCCATAMTMVSSSLPYLSSSILPPPVEE